MALIWMGNRTTLELIGEEWLVMPGIGDRQRNQRQQDLILTVLEELRAARPAKADPPLLRSGGRLLHVQH